MKISRAIKMLEEAKSTAIAVCPNDECLNLAIEGLKTLKHTCDMINIMIWKVPMPKKYSKNPDDWPLFWVAELADKNIYVTFEKDEFVPATKAETEKQLEASLRKKYKLE